MPRNPANTQKTRRGLLARAGLILRSALQEPAARSAPLDLREYTVQEMHRDITTRAFAIRTASYDKATRSVEAVLATDNRVQVLDWHTWTIIDEVLRMDGLAMPESRQVPLLDTHNRNSIFSQLGSTRELRIEGGQLIGRRFFDSTEDGKDAEIKVRDGHVTDGSIGYSVTNAVTIEPGQTAEVEGRTYTAETERALRVVLAWELREDSLCPIGADGAAKVRADNTPATQNTAANHTRKDAPMNFTQWLTARGMDAARLSAEETTALRTLFESSPDATRADALDAAYSARAAAPPTPPAAPAATGDPLRQAARDAVAAERAAEGARVTAIREWGEMCSMPADNIRAAIESGQDIAAARGAFKAARTEARHAGVPFAASPAIHADGSRGDLNAETITASLCLSSGLGERFVADQIPAARREEVMNAANGESMRGFSLHALMGAVCRAAGRPYTGTFKSDGFIRATRAAEMSLRAGGFSTISLSGILSNVANKAMLSSYEAQEVVWPLICGIRSHNDFKVATRYRLDSSGSFRKVGPDGELKHIGLTDAAYTNQLDTFGAIIALTRQMQINDDLGAFVEIPNVLGRMSAVRKEEAVFVLLLSNPSSFFHADNANLATGAGSALSIAGLSAGIKKFGDQVDPNGKPILVSPSILLTGNTLRVTAEALFKEKLLNESTTAKPSSSPNPHVGLYKPVISAYVDNTAILDQDGAAITGQSSTLWYLLANPAVRAAVAMAFLNGKRTPTIESSEAEFNTLGMQWRAYDDFGVGMEEPVAAEMNAGV